MASSPVMASGMLTGVGAGVMSAAGMAGVPDLTGLGGLFGALMNGSGSVQTLGAGVSGMSFGTSAPAEALPAGLGDALAEAGFDVEAFLATQGAVEQTLQLEEDAPAVTVKGDAETVQAFVAQVQAIYQSVIVGGGLTLGEAGDSEALAGALQQLGMDAETATGVAERIETMMQLVEQYQGKQKELDAEEAGTLVAMMLAVMGQATQAPVDGAATPPFSVEISTVEQTLTFSSRTVTAWQGTGDIARDMLALNGTSQEGVAAPQPKTLRTFEVGVERESGMAKIGMFLPVEEAVAETAVSTPSGVTSSAAGLETGATAQEISLVARAPVTTHAVSRDEVVAKPEGDTFYKLTADANGTETVEAVKPLPPEARGEATVARDLPEKLAEGITKPDVMTTQAQWMQHQRSEALANPAMPAQAAASGTGYAAQVEAIQTMLDKAQVSRQVAVQIQPLLEQGGGTVRLQLNPVELGQITVELTIAEGKVHGAIAASEPRVVEQLARELHTLRQGLADAGLKVGEQGINLMLSGNNGNGQFGQQGQNGAQEPGQQATGGRRGSAGVTGTAEIAGHAEGLASNLAGWVSPDRMLDVNV